MQTNKSKQYWKTYNEAEIKEITDGFKQLYSHKPNKKTITTNQLLDIMEQNMNYILNYEEKYKNYPAPFLPKSKAKDKNGFSQYIIMKNIKSKDNKLITIAKNFRYLISIIKLAENKEIFGHLITKTILKKKREYINTYSDLRCISIVPSLIMVHDKILYSIIIDMLEPKLNKNQFGGRKGLDTTLAKILINYKSTTETMEKILLIDLKKAFDLLDRNILINKIENDNNIDQFQKQLIKNIIQIYNSINVEILGQTINQTKGIPQGSVFGPLFFIYYINDVLNIIQDKYKNEINIQAFIDDIAIQSKEIVILQEIFNQINEEIRKLNMEINTTKCELITNDVNDKIINIYTNEQVPNVSNAKYLGQSLNNMGEPINIITKNKLGTIKNIIGINGESLPSRINIKIFKIWMKSKINHLIPLIALTDGLYDSWKNIRSVIFSSIIKRLTLPLESASLIGISFYDIFFKPLLKIREKYLQNKQEEMAKYIEKALKKTAITWKNVEPNLTNTIINNIVELNNGNIKDIDTWNKDIKEQAYIRLFKNQIIPEVKPKILKLKMPQIINLLSNAPTHILEGIIKENVNSLLSKEIKKKLTNQLAPYILIDLFKEKNIIKLEQPDGQNLNAILEYQTLYSLKTKNFIYKNIDTIIKAVNNKIENEIINYNADIEGNIHLNNATTTFINNCKAKIYEMKIETWDLLEDIIEELHMELNKLHAKKQEKRKIGRPKKQHYIQINQPSIEAYLKKEKQEEEENINNINADMIGEEMDLDN